MTRGLPAETYYRACVGRWRAPLTFEITDHKALARSGMAFRDRLSLRVLAGWPRWLSALKLDTSVAFVEPSAGAEVVIHTTTVRWLGLPLRRSVERYTLDADGRRFAIGGDMEGSGSVDDSATRAEYTIRWLGTEIRQRTHRVDDRVTIEQEGVGFCARIVLRRLPDGR